MRAMIGQAMEWLGNNEWFVWVASGASLAIILVSMILIPVVVARIPADYYTHEERPPGLWKQRQGPLRWAIRIGKNVLGVLLLLAGLAMLALPGQGVLTIIVGILLLDIPGKYRLEKRLVRTRGVRRGLNWLRRKAGREELRFEPRRPRRGSPPAHSPSSSRTR